MERGNAASVRCCCSAVCELVGVIGLPVVLLACAATGIEQAAGVSFAAACVALVLVFCSYELSRPRLRDVMPTAVLAALAAAGRILFAPVPDFKPVSAIAIIAGVVFGRRSGFMVGALAALVSNFFFGQGAWTPWQMYAWGMVGWGAGLLGRTRVAEHVPLVCVYGFLACLGYGLIINLWSILGFFHAETLPQIAAVYAAALPFDCIHGAATVVFLLVLYAPWRRKLARIQRKYALRG